MSRYTKKAGGLKKIVELHRLGRIDRDEAESRFRRYAHQQITDGGGDRTDHLNMCAVIDEVVRHEVEDWPQAVQFWTLSIVAGAPWVKVVRPATGAPS